MRGHDPEDIWLLCHARTESAQIPALANRNSPKAKASLASAGRSLLPQKPGWEINPVLQTAGCPIFNPHPPTPRQFRRITPAGRIMNVVAIIHFVAACLAVAFSLPLISGRVRMNPWYGIRIPAAFESEERWRELNCYGGKLLSAWGIVIGAIALCGMPLPRHWWVAYNLLALVPIFGGLLWVVFLIHRRAKR